MVVVGVHRRVNGTGRDRVGSNPVCHELHGQRSTERWKGGFGNDGQRDGGAGQRLFGSATIAEMLTIWPDFCFRICATIFCVTKKYPATLVPIIVSKSSGVYSVNGLCSAAKGAVIVKVEKIKPSIDVL